MAVTHSNCTISSAAKKLYISTPNGSLYSCTLSGAVQNSGADQGSELNQMVGDNEENLEADDKLIKVFLLGFFVFKVIQFKK